METALEALQDSADCSLARRACFGCRVRLRRPLAGCILARCGVKEWVCVVGGPCQRWIETLTRPPCSTHARTLDCCSPDRPSSPSLTPSRRPPSPRAPSLPPPCTRYPTSRARPGTAGRRWLPRPAFRSRGPTTRCPSQLRSSALRRPRAPRPSSRPAPRSICPSTCPSRRICRGPIRTTSCGRARGQRRAGPIRKGRQRPRPPTSCPYTHKMSTTCGTCVGT